MNMRGSSIVKIAAAFVLVLAVAPLRAQSTPGVASNPEEARRGEKLFVQRCSLCHLGVPPAYKTYGPLLSKELIAQRGEDAIRKTIMEGTPRMPGWKYGLKPADIDQIITYLKTVARKDIAHKPAGEGAGEQVGGD